MFLVYEEYVKFDDYQKKQKTKKVKLLVFFLVGMVFSGVAIAMLLVVMAVLYSVLIQVLLFVLYCCKDCNVVGGEEKFLIPVPGSSVIKDAIVEIETEEKATIF